MQPAEQCIVLKVVDSNDEDYGSTKYEYWYYCVTSVTTSISHKLITS